MAHIGEINAVEWKLTDLEFLISRWSIETHTFVVLCEKVGPSLEDVAMLTSLPLFDEAHGTSPLSTWRGKKRIDFLTKSLLKSRYSANNATYLS